MKSEGQHHVRLHALSTTAPLLLDTFVPTVLPLLHTVPMVQRAMKFTPEVLLSAPRRSAGTPNPSGTHVLYTTSTYNFQTHAKTIELRVLEVESGDSHRLAKDDEVSDFNWLDDDTFACLQAEKDGSTSVYVASVSKCIEKKPELGRSHYVAGKIEAAASNLKVCRLDNTPEDFAVVLSAQVCPDGSLFTTEKANKKTHSSGRLYSSLYVRHWDHYVEVQKNCLWHGKLAKGGDGKYALSGLSNALKSTGLECPISPFGGTDCFDVSAHGIIFVAKDPTLNPALNTKCNVYLLHMNDWTSQSGIAMREVHAAGYEGAATSPVFDATGENAAFLMMERNGYEADSNSIFVAPGAASTGTGPLEAREVSCSGLESSSNDGWKLSLQSIAFAADGRSILATSELKGCGALLQLDLSSDTKENRISIVADEGYVGDFHPLADGRILISSSSLIDSSLYTIVDSKGTVQDKATWSHSQSNAGSKFGLKSSQVSSVWTPAANPEVNKEIHSWVMKPSAFDSSKKYPVAYLIHGGPQGSWADSWSTRWNPAVYAEQGYIVVCPNPTGSTGYGQAFTDAIRGNWGGDPYEDIVKCFEWIGENMPEADNSRAVALGASYGGYMVCYNTSQ